MLEHYEAAVLGPITYISVIRVLRYPRCGYFCDRNVRNTGESFARHTSCFCEWLSHVESSRPAELGLFVRFENAASCINARHAGSRRLCLLALWRSDRQCLVCCLCRTDCAALCYACDSAVYLVQQ